MNSAQMEYFKESEMYLKQRRTASVVCVYVCCVAFDLVVDYLINYYFFFVS